MNKTVLNFGLILGVLSLLLIVDAQSMPIEKIKNFNQVSESLASSGMLETKDFDVLNKNNYQHVITLLPGNHKEEKLAIEALGLTFEQIEVDWRKPTLNDFKNFVKLMTEYQDGKVIVHCYKNYRASAFTYLYQVTQQGVADNIAKEIMFKIWQPENTWLEFINEVKDYYQNKV